MSLVMFHLAKTFTLGHICEGSIIVRILVKLLELSMPQLASRKFNP
jgi:hypothetical protein